MAEEQWPTLEEIEAQDRGRIDEAKVPRTGSACTTSSARTG